MKKYLLLLCLVFILFANRSMASHIIGGEITWECLSSGNPNAGEFIFTMKIYRDCLGTDFATTPQTLSSNSVVSNIILNFVSRTDISPRCDPSGYNYTCSTAAANQDSGAVEELIFRSSPIVINGAPPAAGWTFWWTSCCRNGGVKNIVPNSITLRAKMYPYNGVNTYPCYDSSPNFIERPNPVVCAGYSFNFNPNGIDPDQDSLFYDWAEPFNTGISTPVTWKNPYSYTNPLPDTSLNPLNDPAIINHINGEITFKTVSPLGTFVLCNSVRSYKCGVLVAEIFRDFHLLIKPCSPIIAGSPPTYNNAPSIQPPFVNPGGGILFSDTVYAGDSVCFPINITDPDITSSFQFQTIHLEPTGQQLSRTFSDPNDCSNPPCATISPNPAVTTGQINLSFTFCWRASCNHVRKDSGCLRTAQVHHFVFKAFDDFCPIPGLNIMTVSIVVIDTNTSPASIPTILFSNDTLFCIDTGAYIYQWFLDSVAIPGAISNYFVPISTGNYSVVISNCISSHSSAPYFFLNTGVAFANVLDKISVIPNPFNDKVRIRCENKRANPVEIRLLNIVGKQVSFFMNESPTTSFEQEMDYSFLPPGIYLLQIKSGAAQKTIKLVKWE